MIGYLKGKILDLSTETALILSGSGVGFEVNISGMAYDKLVGNEFGELYTYMQVKEDGINLYGFASVEEKTMFTKLISVSGVGPKLGIAVLSSIRLGELAAAIATSDVKRLSMAKGMGKKTAERVILELREKVSAADVAQNSTTTTPTSSLGDEDAVVALMSLNFTRQESLKAIARAKEQGAKSLEDIIMLALKGM